MYRMVEGKSLKPYYYRAVKSKLYCFSTHHDKECKRVAFFDPDFFLSAFKTILKTSQRSA